MRSSKALMHICDGEWTGSGSDRTVMSSTAPRPDCSVWSKTWGGLHHCLASQCHAVLRVRLPALHTDTVSGTDRFYIRYGKFYYGLVSFPGGLLIKCHFGTRINAPVCMIKLCLASQSLSLYILYIYCIRHQALSEFHLSGSATLIFISAKDWSHSQLNMW